MFIAEVMKKTAIIFLAVILTGSVSNAYAQWEFPLEVGTAWTIAYRQTAFESASEYISGGKYFVVDASKIVDGKEYFRLTGSHPFRPLEWFRFDEDTEILYRFDNGEEKQLMDFTLQDGDEVRFHGVYDRFQTVEVTEGEVFVLGQYRPYKAIRYEGYGSGLSSYYTVYFVDGLGILCYTVENYDFHTSRSSTHNYSAAQVYIPGEPPFKLSIYPTATVRYSIYEETKEAGTDVNFYIDAVHPLSRAWVEYDAPDGFEYSPYLDDLVIEYRIDEGELQRAVVDEPETHKRYNWSMPRPDGAVQIDFRLMATDLKYVPDTTYFPGEGYLEYELK